MGKYRRVRFLPHAQNEVIDSLQIRMRVMNSLANPVMEMAENMLCHNIHNGQAAKSRAPSETKIECDPILHYLKSAVNINNSADTDQTTKISPALQVNTPNISSTKTRPIHSISSAN